MSKELSRIGDTFNNDTKQMFVYLLGGKQRQCYDALLSQPIRWSALLLLDIDKVDRESLFHRDTYQ